MLNSGRSFHWHCFRRLSTIIAAFIGDLIWSHKAREKNGMNLLRNLKEKAKKLKSEAQVLMLAYKDKRTPASAKILIGITVGYLLSPIDLIPDFIPILGLLDDLIIVPALISLSIKLIPQTVLNDAREQIRNNPQRFEKNNWLFATIIVIVWLLVLYFVYVQVRRFWKY